MARYLENDPHAQGRSVPLHLAIGALAAVIGTLLAVTTFAA